MRASAAGTISQLAHCENEICDALRSLGACSAIVELLCSGDGRSMDNAAKALRNMLSAGAKAQTQALILDAGGLPALLAAVERAEEGALSGSLGVLMNLASHPRGRSDMQSVRVLELLDSISRRGLDDDGKIERILSMLR